MKQFKKQAKLDMVTKLSYLILGNFWPPVTKFYICNGDWNLDSASTQFWHFCKIS